MDKEEAKKGISALVQVFKDNIKQYDLPTYKEAQARREFIDKFFYYLGWDIGDEQGFS
jgi:predicted type IV restriction endonuclease